MVFGNYRRMKQFKFFVHIIIWIALTIPLYELSLWPWSRTKGSLCDLRCYKDWQFRAFTYHLVGNTLEQTGPGEVFSVVMIQCPQPPQVQLPEQVFYENGVLCDYQNENLNVETLHDRIEKLGELAKGL